MNKPEICPICHEELDENRMCSAWRDSLERALNGTLRAFLGWDSDSSTPLEDLVAMQLRNATPVITIRSIARYLDPPLDAFTKEK
jgi:hypothetical protein